MAKLTGKSKNPGPKEEQFNKGKSYDEDDGKAASGAGSSDMGDEQFDSHLQDSPRGGKLGSKSSGGKLGSFDGQNISPAAAIMREVAKASQKAEQHPTKYQGSKKVSSPKSDSQTKSFNASSKASNPTGVKTGKK